MQYQKAIEFDNTNPQAHYNLGNALLFQNKAEDAMKEYDSAVKFERNKERDARVIKTYQDECWRICVVWECAIRGKNSRRKKEKVTEQIIQWLEEPEEPFLEISG